MRITYQIDPESIADIMGAIASLKRLRDDLVPGERAFPPRPVGDSITDDTAAVKAINNPFPSETDAVAALRVIVDAPDRGVPAAVELLASFGAKRVTDIPPARRAEFIGRAKEMVT